MTLPPTWITESLKDACSLLTDGAHHSPSNSVSGDFPYITAKNIKWAGLSLRGLTYVSKTEHEEIYRRCPVARGDILLIKDGATTGVATINELDEPFSMLSSVALLRPANDLLNNRFLWHWLKSESAQNVLLGAMGGSAIRRLTLKKISQTKLPIPPMAEQRRIVAKLDALTARIARARAELDRVPVLAARLRSLALREIFDSRRAEFAGIAVVSVGDASEISSGYGFPKHFQGKTEGMYPFAKVSDISQAVTKQGGLLTKAANYVDEDDLKQLRAKPVAAGSTVFAKIGEALRLNRRALAQCDVILDNNCMALTPQGQLDPEYLFYFMQTVDLAPFAVATTVPSVRRGDIAGLQLPLPELERQAELVEVIKVTFARADHLEIEATRARALLDRLEAAILARAFLGQLVPQDPNDEPASVLLDRIHAQRAAAPKPKRGRRKKAGVA